MPPRSRPPKRRHEELSDGDADADTDQDWQPTNIDEKKVKLLLRMCLITMGSGKVIKRAALREAVGLATRTGVFQFHELIKRVRLVLNRDFGLQLLELPRIKLGPTRTTPAGRDEYVLVSLLDSSQRSIAAKYSASSDKDVYCALAVAISIIVLKRGEVAEKELRQMMIDTGLFLNEEEHEADRQAASRVDYYLNVLSNKRFLEIVRQKDGGAAGAAATHTRVTYHLGPHTVVTISAIAAVDMIVQLAWPQYAGRMEEFKAEHGETLEELQSIVESSELCTTQQIEKLVALEPE